MFTWLPKLSIRLQLWGLFGLFLFAGAAVLIIDEIEQYNARLSLQDLQTLSMRRMRLVKTLSDGYGEDVVGTAFRVRNNLITWNEGIARVDAARKRIDDVWTEIAGMQRTERQQKLYEHALLLRVPADAAVEDLSATLVKRDIVELGRYADTRMYPAIDPLVASTAEAADYALDYAENSIRTDIERSRQVSALRIELSLLAFLIAAFIGRRILRNIYRGVESLRRLSQQMREHQYGLQPNYRPQGELGSVMDAFLDMRNEIQRSEAELTGQLAHNEEVRAQLVRRDQFQRSLMNAAQAAIMIMDGQGRWTVFNPAAERMLGFRADEIIGRVPRYGSQRLPDDSPILVPAEDIAFIMPRLRQTHGQEVPADWRALYEIAELNQATTEGSLLHKDGHAVSVLMAWAAVHNTQGVRSGLIAVATDLTAIKHLQQQLRESEARAIEANHAKSAFLAAMSHEIRTPMIGVTGMVELLAHTSLDTEQRQSLSVIQSSAQSLLQIIGDILDFSKVEAGRMELAPTAVRLSRVMQSTVANFSGPASSMGLVLTCTVDERIGEAHYADALRLRQILSNFLSNAIKFTDKGSVQAVLELKHFDPTDGKFGSDELEFRVIDSGIGISAEAQARLFQPFSQAEGNTTRRFGGTGLGLVICRRLAELMNGEVTMQSAPRRGTTMRLKVKLYRAPIQEVEADSITETAITNIVPRKLPTTADAERERSLILLVDDHPTNRMVIARQLALAGFASEAAVDGEEGLQKWRSGRYALLLSDVHMPKLDGYQMATAIREEEARDGRSHTPIIALTAAVLTGEAERCIAAGMDDYLAKPVSIPKLAATVQRWLPHIQPVELAATEGSPTSSTNRKSIPAEATPLVGVSILDGVALDVLTGGNPKETRSLLDDFLTSTASDLDDLDAARSSGDIVSLTRQAHKIKGAARLVGATELGEAAAALEAAGRDSQNPDVAAMATFAANVHSAAERLRVHVTASFPA